MKVNLPIPIRSLKGAWFVALLGLFAQNAPAQFLSMQGENVTIMAKGYSLPEVLTLFAEQGVKINMDPGIDLRIDQDFVDVSIDDALESLLQDFGYVSSWEVIKGPVGNYPKLAGIDVYRKGYAHRVRPLVVRPKGIQVVRDPAGFAYARDEFLIGVKEGTTLAQFRDLVSAVGGTVVSSISGRGVYRVILPPGSNVPAVVARLENHPRVAAVEPNYVVEEPGPQQLSGSEDAAAVASAGDGTSSAVPPKAREGASTVAVLDTGLSSTIDMGSLVKGTHDALNPGAKVGDATGHGTQMAMIASGLVNPTGTAGVEADGGTPVLAIKAFDDEGITTNYGLMESIQYAVDNDAKVLSLSWGSEVNSEFLQDSVSAAQERDLIVVAAVGNEASGVPSYPAAYDGVIGVGALGANGELWENSNYGSFVDLVAPGHAEFPIGHEGPPGTYVGTSISTAYVAGYVGQLITENPNASDEEIVEKLYGSVSDAGATGTDSRYGRGRLTP